METAKVSISRWLDKEVVCIYMMEYYSDITKNKFCHLQQHGWSWRILYLLKCQTEKDKCCIPHHLHMESKNKQTTTKKELMTITKRNRLTDIENKLVVTRVKRERRKEKTEVGIETQTIIYNRSYKDLLYNTGNIANILQW